MKRLILIACVMLAGCEASVHVESTPKLNHRVVASVGWDKLVEIRHNGKVYLVLANHQGSAPTYTKLDEWPDTQPKEAKP